MTTSTRAPNGQQEPPAPDAETRVAAEAPSAQGPAPVAQAPDYKDLFLRATAELDNYRKRAERERQALAQYASESVVRRLLDPLDSFDRALREFERALAEAPQGAQGQLRASIEGLRALKRQIQEVLSGEGLEAFDPKGEAFDPEAHEALAKVARADVPDGAIVDVIQVGYRLRGRLLRPARVTVAAAREGPAPPSESGDPAGQPADSSSTGAPAHEPRGASRRQT